MILITANIVLTHQVKLIRSGRATSYIDFGHCNFFWTYILHTQHRQHTHGNIIPASLHKQVRGTTKCINSDKGGQNCKISLNSLFYFISSHHLTKTQVDIWYHLSSLGTIIYISLFQHINMKIYNTKQWESGRQAITSNFFANMKLNFTS